jgi:hypothetical protein
LKKLILNIFVFAMLGTGVCFGAFSNNDAGTATAQFLKLGAGARAAGMGEAVTGIANDSTAIYWNPAGLNRFSTRSLSFMHAVWFEDISYDWFSYAQPLPSTGVVGVAIQYLSYGSLKEIDSLGVEGDSFSPKDMALTLSYARKINKTNLGLNVKYISSQIKGTATAYAIDFGVIRSISKKLRTGFAIQNLGTKMSFISREDNLPLNIKIGGSFIFNPSWVLALDLNAPVDNNPFISLGTEYNLEINPLISVAGRLGYNNRNKDTGGLNSITTGLGVSYLNYGLDYAFVPYGELGNTHRISFKISF